LIETISGAPHNHILSVHSTSAVSERISNIANPSSISILAAMMSNLPTAAGSLDLQVILEIVRVTWVVVVHAIHRRSVENFDEPVQRQGFYTVTVSKEEGDCILCLEMRADELMRHLISGELTNYRVVRTSPEPLHTLSATALSK
jgi:hypothetical protein